jgi:2-oxoglutarate ferredoxin oxidoreductase subunit gamma
MTSRRATFQFCGFGGQGLVLSASVLGAAAVLAGFNAVQTQSYGSEARGGECQAELTVSSDPIYSPTANAVDVLVAMSQAALDRYINRLKSGGTLVIDPHYVTRPERDGVTLVEVPVTDLATDDLGNRLVANILLLGFLRHACDVVPESEFLSSVEQNVPERFRELNLRAAERGKRLAIERGIKLEV